MIKNKSHGASTQTRYTGVIRTLPHLYANKNQTAYDRMLSSFDLLASGRIPAIYIALSQLPKIDVLHLYLLIEGKIICRFNLAGFIDGADQSVKCWDEVSRTPKWWAICANPISFPPDPILRRGFQGFRYTEDLW